LGSAVLVTLAAAASIATSPRREHAAHAAWEVQAPAAQAPDVVLRGEEPEAQRGVEVQATRAIVDHEHWAGGTITLSGSVRWIDPPADPRPARLAIDFVPIGLAESSSVRKEIEIGRKAEQFFELTQGIALGRCVKGAGCTARYDVRFAWLKPRGGELEIVWGVEGSVGSQSEDGTTAPPEGASLTITPIDPSAPARAIAVPVTGEPDPFPASEAPQP
jgi:hypothetical protein